MPAKASSPTTSHPQRPYNNEHHQHPGSQRPAHRPDRRMHDRVAAARRWQPATKFRRRHPEHGGLPVPGTGRGRHGGLRHRAGRRQFQRCHVPELGVGAHRPGHGPAFARALAWLVLHPDRRGGRAPFPLLAQRSRRAQLLHHPGGRADPGGAAGLRRAVFQRHHPGGAWRTGSGKVARNVDRSPAAGCANRLRQQLPAASVGLGGRGPGGVSQRVALR